MSNERPIVIMGAGPAGLTAAWYLSMSDQRVVVLESDPHYIGGLARTVEDRGFLIDIGGHRFSTYATEVMDVWQEIMPKDFIECTRRARIYTKGKFLSTTPTYKELVSVAGLTWLFKAHMSYRTASTEPIEPEISFKDWAINRFGENVFQDYLRHYAEKVWGIGCDQLNKSLMDLHIGDLNLNNVFHNAYHGWPVETTSKSLEHTFHYPKRGPGQMWERAASAIRAKGNAIRLDRTVQNVHWEEGEISHVTSVDSNGKRYQQEGTKFISTLPLPDLLEAMDPKPPKEVILAGSKLWFRDLVTIVLYLNLPNVFSDMWIYVPDKDLKVSRIQNYKNWSIDMVTDPNLTSLGMEYYCFQDDDIWACKDSDLIKLATREAMKMGLFAKADDLLDAKIIRTPKAFPIVSEDYADNIKLITDFLATVPNLQSVGRNGMHKHNNQDHSMVTALLSAQNVLGEGKFDTWQVDTNAEYFGPEFPEGELHSSALVNTEEEAAGPESTETPEEPPADQEGVQVLDGPAPTESPVLDRPVVLSKLPVLGEEAPEPPPPPPPGTI